MLSRQLDRDLLPGYLAQGRIVVDGDSVATDDPSDCDVILNNRENLCIAKAIAGHLRLGKLFAISCQYLDGAPDPGVIEQRVNQRTITLAAKFLRPQLWVLV